MACGPQSGPPCISIRPARSPRNVTIDRFVSVRCVFFQAVKYAKTRFLPGSALDPAGGAYDAPPDTLVGWGGGHPLPIPFPPRRIRHLDLAAD